MSATHAHHDHGHGNHGGGHGGGHGDHHAPASPIFPKPNLFLWGGMGAVILAAVFGWVRGSDVSAITRALLIPFFPLCGFTLQIFFGKKLPRWGDWLPVMMIFTSFCFALTLGFDMFRAYDAHWSIGGEAAGAVMRWMDFGGDHAVKIGVMVDNITVIIALMVTMCAFLIHLFSVEYMEGEVRYNRFFAYIGLFTAAMLGLVFSDNLLTFFMCWELMGLCSYLLIGFYFEKPSACNASLKAFMTTRVGDTVMFLGLLAIYSLIGSLRFEDIYAAIEHGTFASATILGINAATFIGFCIFCGTVGKSAQFPLQVWLPDAMEGPTPVSALIHAATMVSAGVFLIIRMFPMLDVGNVLPLVAFIGGFTAFFAAVLAIVQNDIKKVLAYSTLSQLGYMVLSVGVGGFFFAFMHLITHACFKACLFMGSGSVIKAMHHEQDMRQMGGLSKKLPVTMVTMALATCAISGFPFFSGFVSKDGILAQVLFYGRFAGMDHGKFTWIYQYWAPITGFGAALLTAFYMWRMMFMTFFGKPRNQEKFDHAHENHWPILIPLSVLGVCSLAAVFKNTVTGLDAMLPQAFDWFANLVHPVPVGMYAEGHAHHGGEGHEHAHHLAATISLIVAFGGAGFSALVYVMRAISADTLERLWPRFMLNAIHNLYYFDWFYIKVVIKKILLPWNRLMAFIDNRGVDFLVDIWATIAKLLDDLAGWFDDLFVDGMFVDGLGGGVAAALGEKLRALQNGYVQIYFLVAVASIGIPLMYFLVWHN